MNTNCPRRLDSEIVIYTPAFGKSTKTNCWGEEIAIAAGKIIDASNPEESGDMKIPGNGCVFSIRGLGSDIISSRGDNLSARFRKGNRVFLWKIPRKIPAQAGRIALPGTPRRAMLALTCARPVFRNKILLKVCFIMKNGKKQEFPVTGKAFTDSYYTHFTRKRMYLVAPHLTETLPHPVLALESDAEKGSSIQAIELEATPEGIMSGITVLGGMTLRQN